MEKTYQHGFENLPTMLSVADIMELTKMSRNAIATSINLGRLKAYNLTSEHRPKYRIMRDDFIAWATSRQVPATRSEGK